MINEQLKKHILLFANPSKDILDELNGLLVCREIKKKDFLLQKGQYCKYHNFILKGCFRSFFIDNKGAEKILNFGVENWWITDFDSFATSHCAEIAIQAIEDSVVLSITKEDLDKLLGHSLEMNRYFRILTEKVRVADQRRMQYMFNMSGKELYDFFCLNFPEFVQRIPLYMLASYFNFTPEFLSKVRGSK